MSTLRERPTGDDAVTNPMRRPEPAAHSEGTGHVPDPRAGARRHTPQAGALAVAVVAGLALLVLVVAGVVRADADSPSRATSTGDTATSSTTDTAATGTGTAPAAPFALPAAVGAQSTITLPGTTTYTSTKALALHDRTLFVGTYDNGTYTKTVGPSTVAITDATTGAVEGSITTSRGLLGLVASADGRRLWATASVDDVVDVIDVPTRSVVARVPTGDMPQGIAMAPDGRTVYVTNYSSGTVVALDTATSTVRATASVGEDATELALSPDGRTLAVGHEGAVAVLDAATLRGTDVAVGYNGSPACVAFSPDGRRLFVDSSSNVSGSASTLATIDVASRSPTGEVQTPSLPFSLATGRRAVYVGQSAIGTDGTGAVLTVSPDGTAVRTSTTIGYSPSSLLLSADETLLYAVDGSSGVTVLRVR